MNIKEPVPPVRLESGIVFSGMRTPCIKPPRTETVDERVREWPKEAGNLA